MKKISAASLHTQSLIEQVKLEPQDLELLINLGEAYLREGKLKEAIAAYQRALDLDPSSEFRALYWEWMGTINEALGEGAEALKAYTQWSECAPQSIEPIEKMGALMISEGLWTDLLLLRSQYKKLAEDSHDPAILESLALYSYIMEQFGSEEEPSPADLSQAALENKYNSIPMRYLLGLLFLKAGHLEGANAEFSRVIELDEDSTWEETRFNLNWSSASARLMLGRIARMQHRYKLALNYFSACLVPNSRLDIMEPLEEYASLLVEMNLYEEALSLLSAEIEALGSAPWIQRLSARCLLGLGRVREACQLFAEETPGSEEDKDSEQDESDGSEEMLLELNTDSGEINLVSESLELKASKAKDATKTKENKVEDKEDNEKEAPLSLELAQKLNEANTLLQAGSLQEAQAVFEAFLNQMPQNCEGIIGLAKTKAALGNTDQAVELLEQLVAVEHANIEVWQQLSQLYKQTGKEQEYRLTRIQIQTLLPDILDQPKNEWIAPAVPDSGATGLGISARSLPGEGKLTITGVANSAATVNVVWTFLRAEAERLSLPELKGIDMHVHIRDLSSEPRLLTPTDGIPLGLQAGSNKEDICNEDIGLAVLMAMVAAINEKSPSGTTVVGGRLDLIGGIHNSSTLVSGLLRLSESGIEWTRLILPRTITVDIDRLPSDIWLNTDLALCTSATQAIKLLDE